MTALAIVQAFADLPDKKAEVRDNAIATLCVWRYLHSP